MTQASHPWDGQTVGDATIAPYDAGEWANLWRTLLGAGSVFAQYGVIPGTGAGTTSELFVRATSPASANVEVAPGAALVNNRLYSSSVVETLAVSANASGNPRIDTMVLRIDYVLQTVRLAIKVGTPAPSPVAPTLQQDTSIWEMALADIAVANGFSTITNSNITQRKRFIQSTAAGWAPYALPIGTPADVNPSSNIGVTGSSAIAVPFQVAGNMHIARVRYELFGTVTAGVEWGIYIQDVNFKNAGESVLRRVAQSDGVTSLVSATGTAAANAKAGAILTPGVYWLVTQAASGTFQFKAYTLLHNSSNYARQVFFTAVGGLTETLDFAAGSVTNDTLLMAARLDGFVLGRSVGF